MIHTNQTLKMKQRPYVIGITLNIVFVLAELVFAKIAHSTALFADAFHNLSDVLALIIAWLAVVVFGLKATKQHTYGWHNMSILASIFNSLLLIFAVVTIFYEGIRDLITANVSHASGATIMIVAAVGIVINFSTAFLFRVSGVPDEHGHQSHDLNEKTAYVHLLADAGVSLGVVVAGLLIQWTGLVAIDAIVSLIIGVVIAVTSWPMVKSTFNLALNGVPDGIDEVAVAEYIANHSGVAQFHDLHIWPLSTTETALTVHLSLNSTSTGDAQMILEDITSALRTTFHISHVTIQIETSSFDQTCNQI
ncbi:cation diffusion facilitator family transporter [Leuconostoc falkenbergense]|uniref:cation diffusion facilitator family transporter n=1 Tax=Leuconostoc falkenbergense TaxID=2766470 RepID=UPI00325CF829